MTEQEVINCFVAKVKQYYNAPRYRDRKEPAHTRITHLFWVLDQLAKEPITKTEVDLRPRTPAEYDRFMEEFVEVVK